MPPTFVLKGTAARKGRRFLFAVPPLPSDAVTTEQVKAQQVLPLLWRELSPGWARRALRQCRPRGRAPSARPGGSWPG